MRRRPHRLLIGLLVALATWVALAAIGVRWVNDQLLSTSGWSRTSDRLIANRSVRGAIAGFSVDQAFGAAGIDQAISSALPGALATRATGALHQAATGTSDAVLSSGAGRRAWRQASLQAHADLLAAVSRPGRRQGVVLDLTPLLRDIVGAVAGGPVARALPGGSQLLAVRSPTAGRLVVLRPRQLTALRVGVRTAQTLDWALPAIAVALYVLALILGYGWRAIVLARVGYSLLIAGAVALAARAVLQYPLSAVFVTSGADRRAVRAAWLIGSSDLRTLAIGVLVAGAVVTLAGWVARIAMR